jgi:hypothetical protein
MPQKLLLILLSTFLFTACSKKVTISFERPKESMPSVNIGKSVKYLIVRAPNQGNNVGSSSAINEVAFYNYMEKEFMKNGFIVRDRAIFDKIITQNIDVDYSRVQALTNTDLIVEVANNIVVPYKTNTVKKGSRMKVYYNCDFEIPGRRVDIKLIDIKKNEVLGVFTFHYTPCEGGCDFTLGKHCDLHPIVKASKKAGYSGKEDNEMEDFAKDITDRICDVLKNRENKNLGVSN